MFTWKRILFAAASLLLLQSVVMAQSAAKADYALNTTNAFANQGYNEYSGKVSIGGVIAGDGLQASYYSEGWIQWEIPAGYTTFTCMTGVDDKSNCNELSCTLTILLDGEPYPEKFEIVGGQKPQQVQARISGAKTLRINAKQTNSGRWYMIQPRLTAKAGGPPPPPVIPPDGDDGINTPPGTLAPFAVDPKDMDTLAAAIRKYVDAKSGLKDRLDTELIAISTFQLIDINSKAVADSVVEDLSTAMINSGFNLVERGQLDKILKELKWQNTGAMAPETIQRIGQLSGCELVLLGSISDRGQSVVVNCRLVETATARSLIAARQPMNKVTIIRQ